ncbi:MAG: hypothetical protein KDD83_29870, partial [Caldilineaceae bacterium]|nr:hypothetical protein [Caldilineaceae bacterium]
LFAKRPGDVSWTLRQLLAAATTELTLADLDGGPYRFLIAAQDEAGAYIAKTEAVDVRVWEEVFLPIARGD